MKKTILKMLFVLLISMVCIIAISCIIGFFIQPPILTKWSSVSDLPLHFFVLISITWAFAFIYIIYSYIKNEENLLLHIVAIILFFSLLFVVTLAGMFIIFAIRLDRNFFELSLEFIKSLELKGGDYLGLLAVLLPFTSMFVILFTVIQTVKRSERLRYKKLIGVLLCVFCIAAVITLENVLYLELKKMQWVGLRKIYDIATALLVILICLIIHIVQRRQLIKTV